MTFSERTHADGSTFTGSDRTHKLYDDFLASKGGLTVTLLGQEVELGGLYDVTFDDGRTKRVTVAGIKRSAYDGTFWVYLSDASWGGEVGFNLSAVVLFDEVAS